jgi:hypothetical protein
MASSRGRYARKSTGRANSRGGGTRSTGARRTDEWAGLRPHEAAVLHLQRAAGNAAVAHVLGGSSGVRSEDDEDVVAGPDWSKPIEDEADERTEPTLQRHTEEDVEDVDERSEPTVQRQEGTGPASGTSLLEGLRHRDGLDWGTWDRRPRVRTLQERLTARGAPTTPDGMFGKKTLAALNSFQGTQSLPATPVVDRPTAQALEGGGAAPARTFPGFSAIRNNGTVSASAWMAWFHTLLTTTPTTRREQGFWVQWDATSPKTSGGSYRAVGHKTGTSVGPTQGATINLGTRPADDGDWFTVASFHTHTPTKHRAVGRVVGPSTADHNADTSDNVTGLVHDYVAVSGGAIPAGHPLLSSATIYKSGPDQRT